MKTSEQINELAEALAKAQGSFSNPERNRTVTVRSEKGNYSFDYATLDAIIEMSRPHLSANGLALVQPVSIDQDWVVVTTRLMHSSGQWIEESLAMKPAGFSPQQIGSASTYGKRYGLTSLLGIAAEEDDDGNHASGNQATMQARPTQSHTAPQANGNGKIEQSQEFVNFMPWMATQIPKPFSNKQALWAEVLLNAGPEWNKDTLPTCPDPAVFNRIKAIMSKQPATV